MAPKPSTRPVVKVGGCTTDWSRSVYDDRGWPVLGGAGWIRLGQWVQFSRNHVVLGTLMNARSRVSVQVPDLSVHADCSTVIMQRCMEKGVAELVCMARSNGQRVINDLDDWFWQISDKNAAANFIDPKKNANSNIDHYRKTLESSDLVTVSTPFLYDRISEWDIPAKLIENRVSVHMFSRRKHREGTPVLGWVGSTAHRSGDLEILRSPFRALGRQVRFHHTGAHPQHPQFHDEVGLESDQVSTTPMLSPYEYPAGFTFDIGVVPLVDVPFNHAKSWIKGLEYAAAGIPFVASPLPEYVRLRDQFGIGRIASNSKEWQDHIEELLDPAVRFDEATRQRDAVQTHFHVKAMAKDFDGVVWA